MVIFFFWLLFILLVFGVYIFLMSFLCLMVILLDFVYYYVCKSFKFVYCGVQRLFKWLYWRLIRLV